MLLLLFVSSLLLFSPSSDLQIESMACIAAFALFASSVSTAVCMLSGILVNLLFVNRIYCLIFFDLNLQYSFVSSLPCFV